MNHFHNENPSHYSKNSVVNKNELIPFSCEWSTEHLNIFIKQNILLSENKYTELLKKILENTQNANVIFDENDKAGYIYNNNIMKQKVKKKLFIEQ